MEQKGYNYLRMPHVTSGTLVSVETTSMWYVRALKLRRYYSKNKR